MVRLAVRCGPARRAGRHRLRHITLLALVIAAMVYAGQAEILALGGLALLVFVVVLLVQRAPLLGGSGPIRRPVLDLSVGVVTGLALGAPLLLPGSQVVSGSQRAVPGGDPAEILKGNPALPSHNLVHVIFQGSTDCRSPGSHWFGYIGGYSETAAYVGVIAVVLAVTAVAVRRRRPEVVAFGVLCVVMVVVAFVPPVVAVLYRLPLIGTVLWQRAILPLAFGMAVLAGVGMDALVRAHGDRAVRRWAGGGFAAVGTVAGGALGVRSGRSPGRPSDHQGRELHLARRRDRRGPGGGGGSDLGAPALRDGR